MKVSKQIVITIVIIFSLFLVGVATTIFMDNRDYFKDYFQSKRDKLNLMNEASVDSLVNIINDNQTLLDSIKNTLILEKELSQKSIEIIQKELKFTREKNQILQSTIEHQNNIIKNCAGSK